MARVIGIDPGLSGALVLVEDDNDRGTPRILECVDMPTHLVRKAASKPTVKAVHGLGLVEWICAVGTVDLIIVELPSTRPIESAASGYTAGRGFGMLEGIFVTLERPWVGVRPPIWTKAMGVGPDKNERRYEAMRLYPLSSSLFDLAKDDGRADATLIATYGMRNQALAYLPLFQ
jgi:crossover junction endodeoxyribonuclease RuvC